MPLMRCERDGKPGWKEGDSGFCYIYEPKKKDSETKARRKAIRQKRAIRATGYKEETS